MTSDRPYRDALRPWIAVSELREGAGGQFDPDVVDALVGALREQHAVDLRLFQHAERAPAPAPQAALRPAALSRPAPPQPARRLAASLACCAPERFAPRARDA